MATGREYDQDTVGDHDENTLDGSEGLDADAITTDGEDLTIDAPESWKSAEENDTLDEKLGAERTDINASAPDDEGVDDESRDPIDELRREGDRRVLGED